jgi:hypothetical protein
MYRFNPWMIDSVRPSATKSFPSWSRGVQAAGRGAARRGGSTGTDLRGRGHAVWVPPPRDAASRRLPLMVANTVTGLPRAGLHRWRQRRQGRAAPAFVDGHRRRQGRAPPPRDAALDGHRGMRQVDSAGPGHGPVAALRAVCVSVPARPEKWAIGSCLGRQFSTTPDTARHEKAIRLYRAGPLSAGPFKASAGLRPGGPFGIL